MVFLLLALADVHKMRTQVCRKKSVYFLRGTRAAEGTCPPSADEPEDTLVADDDRGGRR